MKPFFLSEIILDEFTNLCKYMYVVIVASQCYEVAPIIYQNKARSLPYSYLLLKTV